MSTAAVVLSFLGGGAVGTVVTAVYTTSHERTERFRERMLQAGERFLEAEEQAERRILEMEHDFRDLRRRSEEVKSALRSLREKIAGIGSESWNRLSDVLTRVDALVDAASVYAGASLSADETDDLDEAEKAFTNAIEAFTRDESEGVKVAELEESLTQFARQARRVSHSRRASVEAIRSVGDLTPRLRVLFALGEADDPVTQGGFTVARNLAEWAGAALPPGTDAQTDADAGSAAVVPAVEPAQSDEEAARSALHASVGAFARHVNARVRRRWL